MTRRLAVSLIALASLAPCAPRAGAAASSPPPGAALAVEDTMRTDLPELLVHAPRVRLDEILDRVSRGEARRDSAIRDQSYQMSVRIVGKTSEGRTPELLQEDVTRIYVRRPNQVRSVPLRHWEAHPPKPGTDDKDKHGVRVEVGSPMSEEIVNFAFKPEIRRELRFRIEAREFLGDHVVYRIGFEPRSALDVYGTSGRVWVDTKEYVIVREEIEFRQSPVPLFLRGIKRMVVERQKIGEHWVLRRMLVRIEATIPLPRLGSAFDLGVMFSDYVINMGLADSLFATPAAGKKVGR